MAGVTPADRWDILKLQAELETLRGEVKRLQGIEEKYKAIAQSVEGRQVEATRKSPTLKGCNADYMEDIAGLSGALKSAHKLFLKQFTEMVGADTKLAEITPPHIINFIRADAAAHKDPRRAVRVRTLVSRFINWAARKYQIPPIMSQVPTQRVGAIRDIEWHTLKEVEKVIAELDTYWGQSPPQWPSPGFPRMKCEDFASRISKRSRSAASSSSLRPRREGSRRPRESAPPPFLRALPSTGSTHCQSQEARSSDLPGSHWRRQGPLA